MLNCSFSQGGSGVVFSACGLGVETLEWSRDALNLLLMCLNVVNHVLNGL